MQTQITCPRCRTPYIADVHQIVDVGQQPEMKAMLLNGYLNTAQCPSCGAVTQVATPMLYHDPENELFMVHVPMEMSLPRDEQERLIGQLVKQAMDSLPPEQRRGYMLQPQTVLSMQTFMEKILETEGVTPEMLARQRSQAELLQALISADKETTTQLLADRADEIDEVFFSMLRANMEAAENAGQEEVTLKLVNLQAKLYRETEYGRQLSERQKALHAFSRDAKRNGLSPELLLKHVLENRNDDALVNSLVMNGQDAFNYDFFSKLTEKIEKRQKAGASVDQYVALRERLLEMYQAIEQRSREILGGAQALLDKLLRADDRAAAVRENFQSIDDAFMYVLNGFVDQAKRTKNQAQMAALEEIQGYIMEVYEEQFPPEIRLVNELLEQENETDWRRILDQNQEMLKPEFLEMIKAIKADLQGEERELLAERLGAIESLIQTRLLMA
ncbi:MAG: CpXC domain-containing protein [Candidatus Promineifilaceae bacterium]